jgi:hypothetical protein
MDVEKQSIRRHQALRRNSGKLRKLSIRFINAASCSDNLTHNVQLQTRSGACTREQ